jgi:hypothetical protein
VSSLPRLNHTPPPRFSWQPRSKQLLPSFPAPRLATPGPARLSPLRSCVLAPCLQPRWASATRRTLPWTESTLPACSTTVSERAWLGSVHPSAGKGGGQRRSRAGLPAESVFSWQSGTAAPCSPCALSQRPVGQMMPAGTGAQLHRCPFPCFLLFRRPVPSGLCAGRLRPLLAGGLWREVPPGVAPPPRAAAPQAG